jgi:hypothetical protein
MKTISRRIAAIAVVGAVVFGGLSMAQAASADVMPGTIQLHGPMLNVTTIGPVITGGSLTDSPAFYGITTSVGCPAGYQGRSDTAMFQNGVRLGNVSNARLASTTAYGHTGLDGQPIAMDDTYSIPNTSAFVNNTPFGTLTNGSSLVSGAWELRVYCSALSTSVNYTTDKYFVLPMTADTTAGTWSVYTAPAVKANTTVSLTGAAQADKSVLLTGTVKDATPATATGAVGAVKFFDGSNALIGSGTVASGVGTFTTAVLPVGTYTFTAQFIGSSDPAYNDSSVSAVVTVVISSNVAPVNITVAIPSGVGSLTLTGVASSVNLGTAALNGGVLTASGALPTVTVTDTRQLGSAAWSLTGITTDFTAGSKTLDGKYLGWTPSTVDSATNAGTIGAAVVAGAANGLKTAAILASGSPVDQKTTTKVGATLNLAAPANTPAGAYSATLTLTLV